MDFRRFPDGVAESLAGNHFGRRGSPFVCIQDSFQIAANRYLAAQLLGHHLLSLVNASASNGVPPSTHLQQSGGTLTRGSNYVSRLPPPPPPIHASSGGRAERVPPSQLTPPIPPHIHGHLSGLNKSHSHTEMIKKAFKAVSALFLLDFPHSLKDFKDDPTMFDASTYQSNARQLAARINALRAIGPFVGLFPICASDDFMLYFDHLSFVLLHHNVHHLLQVELLHIWTHFMPKTIRNRTRLQTPLILPTSSSHGDTFDFNLETPLSSAPSLSLLNKGSSTSITSLASTTNSTVKAAAKATEKATMNAISRLSIIHAVNSLSLLPATVPSDIRTRIALYGNTEPLVMHAAVRRALSGFWSVWPPQVSDEWICRVLLGEECRYEKENSSSNDILPPVTSRRPSNARKSAAIIVQPPTTLITPTIPPASVPLQLREESAARFGIYVNRRKAWVLKESLELWTSRFGPSLHKLAHRAPAKSVASADSSNAIRSTTANHHSVHFSALAGAAATARIGSPSLVNQSIRSTLTSSGNRKNARAEWLETVLKFWLRRSEESVNLYPAATGRVQFPTLSSLNHPETCQTTTVQLAAMRLLHSPEEITQSPQTPPPRPVSRLQSVNHRRADAFSSPSTHHKVDLVDLGGSGFESPTIPSLTFNLPTTVLAFTRFPQTRELFLQNRSVTHDVPFRIQVYPWPHFQVPPSSFFFSLFSRLFCDSNCCFSPRILHHTPIQLGCLASQ